MSDLYIVSGPPGSGKSTKVAEFAAEMLRDNEQDGVIISADYYHCPNVREMFRGGIPFTEINKPETQEALKNYEFDVDNLSLAHQWCMLQVIRNLQSSVPNIVVDNTNINSYEISPYYLVGEAFDAQVQILRVSAPLDVCIERNVHSVPAAVITRMHETFSEMTPHPWREGEEMPVQHMPWWDSIRF